MHFCFFNPISDSLVCAVEMVWVCYVNANELRTLAFTFVAKTGLLETPVAPVLKKVSTLPSLLFKVVAARTIDAKRNAPKVSKTILRGAYRTLYVVCVVICVVLCCIALNCAMLCCVLLRCVVVCA